jgi:hypothetical protein
VTEKTNKSYLHELNKTREIFLKKYQDYGSNWRILRISSLIDQIYIKADRIRNIETGKIQKIEDKVDSEYRGIINYSILTLIQMGLDERAPLQLAEKDLMKTYDTFASEAFALMKSKNHDYGEAWRNMYLSSYTDLILSKILRIKQILDNSGITIASEGIDANLMDIINYSFFALIKISEQDENQQ